MTSRKQTGAPANHGVLARQSPMGLRKSGKKKKKHDSLQSKPNVYPFFMAIGFMTTRPLPGPRNTEIRLPRQKLRNEPNPPVTQQGKSNSDPGDARHGLLSNTRPLIGGSPRNSNPAPKAKGRPAQNFEIFQRSQQITENKCGPNSSGNRTLIPAVQSTRPKEIGAKPPRRASHFSKARHFSS